MCWVLFCNVFACWFYANYLTCPRVLVPPECSRLFDGQGTMDFQSRSCIFVTAQCRQDFATPNQSHCLLLSTFLQTAHMSSVNCQKPKWAHPQQVQAKCEPSLTISSALSEVSFVLRLTFYPFERRWAHAPLIVHGFDPRLDSPQDRYLPEVTFWWSYKAFHRCPLPCSDSILASHVVISLQSKGSGNLECQAWPSCKMSHCYRLVSASF